MKKWIKSINDFMLDANRALPEVIRFWVFFMLGMYEKMDQKYQ
nr:MAG TPA: hypothetical protein [Caudoviricetes sp.]